MCGLSVPLRKFDEEQDLDDIKIVEYRGLGRGRGFEVAGTCSILENNELMAIIEERCRAILDLIEKARESN